MKKELIKTENYLLVVDESEIKVNDWYYLPRTNSAYRCQADPTELEMEKRFGVAKVIAHLPINDSADLKGVPLLPPLEDDNNKDLFYQKQVMNPYPTGGQSYASYEKGFIDGYNKAREEYKFTEEDIRDVIMVSFLLGVDRREYSKEFEDEIIKKFSQPKTPTHFEFEMESMTIDEIREQGKGFLHASTFKIKTTNSQGQQVACGKYIFEL